MNNKVNINGQSYRVDKIDAVYTFLNNGNGYVSVCYDGKEYISENNLSSDSFPYYISTIESDLGKNGGSFACLPNLLINMENLKYFEIDTLNKNSQEFNFTAQFNNQTSMNLYSGYDRQEVSSLYNSLASQYDNYKNDIPHMLIPTEENNFEEQ